MNVNLPSPRTNPILYLGILVVIEQAIGHGTVSLANVVPQSWAPWVLGWCNLLAFVGTSIMTALSPFYVSAGVQAPEASAVVPPVAIPAVRPVSSANAKLGLILALVCAGSLGLAASAHAQRIGGPGGRVLDNLGVKPLGAPGTPQGSEQGGGVSGANVGEGIKNLLAKPLQDLADFIGSDNAGAITLSTQIPSLQDLNGKACWMATADFTAVIQAHPVPLTFKLMSDVEAGRLLQWAAYNVCHSTACGIVFNDVQSEATALSGGLAVPNVFTQICSRIANLAPQLPSSVLPSDVTQPAPVAPSAVKP